MSTLTIDDRDVQDWRFEQLRQAGWPDQQALLLALDPQIDLHQACDLVRRCEPALALRILS
jgi:hypothetical protein